MSFWKSVEHKAQKEHRCEVCGKTIKIGEVYNRETGATDGDFNDYALCLRCKYLVESYGLQDDMLGDLWDYLQRVQIEVFICPRCEANYLVPVTIDEDRQNVTCKCHHCKHEWSEDIGLEALRKKEQEDG